MGIRGSHDEDGIASLTAAVPNSQTGCLTVWPNGKSEADKC